jgi:alanine dehydrogenase
LRPVAELRLIGDRENPLVTEIPVISGEAVFAAIDPKTAIECTREAFERHNRGDWRMPAKVYLDSPPYGDFRAMPALGGGLALLKWVTSFPANTAKGLPVVRGAVMLSDAETGEELGVIECSSVTALRTGAAAAVSAQVLAVDRARSVGIIGCGVNGAWSARCLAAVGYGAGVCADVRTEAAEALAGELGWRVGDRAEAAAQDVVVTITPGNESVILASDLRPGQHIAALGADAHGKQEVELEAIERCRLFCDEWEQASAGGELANAVEAGIVRRDDVIQLGDVLSGGRGRGSDDEITLFDSTGLAIQDLAICRAVYERWKSGEVGAPLVSL